MTVSAHASRTGNLARVRRAFENLLRVAPSRRYVVARRRHAGDQGLLAEVLRLLDHANTTSGFLEPPPTRQVKPDTAVRLRAPPGRLLGRRWRLAREVGRGGEGVVCEARDDVTGTRVAVKLLRAFGNRDERRIRREAATLRWLRLPGVVEILDDGIDHGVVWIVTSFADGTPFPGASCRSRWADLEPFAAALLEAIGRVHAAGIIHGDLKPSNVLVGPSGSVTLLDLGLASARTDRFTEPEALGGGTPGYLAPECLAGAAPDVQSDLFAVGVMLAEALRPEAIVPARESELRRLHAPPHVLRALARLLAEDPSRRPSSAAEAINLLRPTARPVRRRRWTATELRRRFRGPDRFLHLREDAARVLHERTNGESDRVEEELASWMRAGLARTEEGLVVVDREAVARIAAMPGGRRERAPRSTLLRALRSGRSREVVAAALRAADAEFNAGRASRAITALEEGASAARALGDRQALREIACRAVAAAINSGVGRDIDRALWLVQRGDEHDPELDALADVARAAGELIRGHSSSAWRISTRVTRSGPSIAQRVAWSVREMAARALGPANRRQVISESASWVRSSRSADSRLARVTWRASDLYLRGRCAEAYRLSLNGIRFARNPSVRVRMMIDAAAAAMDSGKVIEATRLARSAMTTARRLRRPVQELRAWTLLRDARFRRGNRLRVDTDSIDAADHVGFHAQAVALRAVEAAIAWRQRDLDLVRRLVEDAASRVDPESASAWELLVAAIAISAGVPTDRRRTRGIALRATRMLPPGVAVQVLALLALGTQGARGWLSNVALRVRLPRGRSARRRRREVLSIEESLAILGVRSSR